MELFPAIDLLGGCAVRLQRGDYEKVTVYSKEPLQVARYFQQQGAKYLHVVDLDGARDGSTQNLAVIRQIVDGTDLQVEVGGGIRSMQVLQQYLCLGVYRCVLGTAALEDPEFLQQAVKNYGGRVAVGADVRDGKIAVRGWKETSSVSLTQFMAEMQRIGVETVICTDISRDGLLGGTNIELYRQLSKDYGVQIVASGGVSTYDDLQKLCALGIYGAIIGKALYTADMRLDRCVALCTAEENP